MSGFAFASASHLSARAPSPSGSRTSGKPPAAKNQPVDPSHPAAAPRTPRSAQRQALSGDVLATLINLSGRRRFTSQRLVLYVVLASLGHEGALGTARDALAMFRAAHDKLIHGDADLPGIHCEAMHEAYYGVLQGERRIRAFIDLAGRALDALESTMARAPVLLAELIAGATPLLEVLNALTQVYEELSREQSKQMRRQLRDVMSDIETIARQARMVSFNAQIVAARAGHAGREFAVVAGELTGITGEIDALVQQALGRAGA